MTGAATFAVWNVIKKDEAGQGEQPETVEVNEAVKVADDSENVAISEEVVEDETNGGKKVTQYEGEDPNKAEELSGVVTMASVVDGTLMIRTNIDQYLGAGSCELQILRGGEVIYSSTANIVAAASTATCQGFDVPVAAVGSGEAQIIINLNAEGKNGTMNSEVNI